MTMGPKVLAISCGIEAVTGLGMLVAPTMLVELVLGTGIEGAAIIICNLAGLALISLSVACWPRGDARMSAAYFALLIYNLLAGLLLARTGATMMSGPLLWPVVVTHLVLAVLIGMAMLDSRRRLASQG